MTLYVIYLKISYYYLYCGKHDINTANTLIPVSGTFVCVRACARVGANLLENVRINSLRGEPSRIK